MVSIYLLFTLIGFLLFYPPDSGFRTSWPWPLWSIVLDSTSFVGLIVLLFFFERRDSKRARQKS